MLTGRLGLKRSKTFATQVVDLQDEWGLILDHEKKKEKEKQIQAVALIDINGCCQAHNY